MKAKELLQKLSVCNPEDNITFYYLKNHTLINCQLESFFDCNYEDVNGGVDYELTIQETKEGSPTQNFS